MVTSEDLISPASLKANLSLPTAMDYKNTQTLRQLSDSDIQSLINKVFVPDPSPVDNYLIIGLSKGTIIFV